jgi:hypothetical protein
MLIAIGLAGCGALLLASGLRHWQGAVSWSDWARTHHAWMRLAVIFILILAYILAAPMVGFVPVSILILLVFMKMMGVPWWVAAAVTLVATLLIQQTFVSLLRVPLPLGLLGP